MSTKALNVTKTIGVQSIILRISSLLLDTIYREEHYLKALLRQLLFKPSPPGILFESFIISSYPAMKAQWHLAQ
ncbi:MAG: hypothetical protein RR376_21200, partial [Janthinobacterium sp.]